MSRLRQEARLAATARGQTEQNADVIAVTNATLLTMEAGDLIRDLIEDAVMVVRGGVIESVGCLNAVNIPQGATIINAYKGTTSFCCCSKIKSDEFVSQIVGFIVPGFIDVHAHWGGFRDLYPARSWELNTFLAYGVTTLHK